MNLAVIAAIALACTRIIGSYSANSHTADETIHIVAGMEYLQYGSYTIEALHPPLGRVVTAIGPYLGGLRLQPDSTHGSAAIFMRGLKLLDNNGAYTQHLAWARLGILPFFILATLCTFYLGSFFFRKEIGAAAAICFSLLPPVLAHSGLATTDMPATAMLLASVVALLRAYRLQQLRHWLVAGVICGIALSTKFSIIVFSMPPLLLSIGSYWWLRRKKRLAPYPQVVRTLLLFCLFCFLTIWSVYRFSFAPIGQYSDDMYHFQTISQRVEHRLPESHPLHAVMHTLLSLPLPAPEYGAGFLELLNYNSRGHSSYFLGSSSPGILTRLFFPVVMLSKLPITALFFFFGGFIVLLWQLRREPHIPQLLLLAAYSGCFLLTMTSGINIGVRHLLPLMPFFAMIASFAFFQFITLGSTPRITKVFALSFVVLLFAESFSAKPEYLAWYNSATRPYQSSISIDSDLDWGQNVHRAYDTIRTKNLFPAFVVAPALPSSWGTAQGEVVVAGFDNKDFSSYKYIAIGYLALYTIERYAPLRTKAVVATVGESMLILQNRE